MRYWKLAALLAAVTVFTLGCSGDGPLGSATQEDGLLRVAHLSPDAPAVDVWVDGDVVLANVPFEAVSDYLSLPPGTFRIQVTPAGASSPVVIDADVPVSSGTSQTVAACLLYTSPSPRDLSTSRMPSSA